MRLRIEGDAEELRAKSRGLLLEVAKRLAIYDPVSAQSVVDALAPPPLSAPASASPMLLIKAFPVRKQLSVRGVPIAIEHPAGSTRPWKSPDGRSGTTKMQHHYGYVRGHDGADGDGFDCFVRADVEDPGLSPFVYVVHQMTPPDFEQYDEDKVLIGWADPAAASSAYLAHYDDERFLSSMSQLTWEDFKERLETLDRPDADGMMKARLHPVIKAGLHTELGAEGSMMGGRMVTTGSSGLNIALGVPMRVIPENDSRSGMDSLLGVQQTDRELAYARHSADARKRGILRIAGAPVPAGGGAVIGDMGFGPSSTASSGLNAPAFALPDPEQHRAMHEGARADAPLNEALLIERLKRRDANRVRCMLRAQRPSGWSLAADLDKGTYEIACGDRRYAMRSLTEACDEVWARERGHADAAAARKTLSKRRLPSGASWMFWGLHPPEARA